MSIKNINKDLRKRHNLMEQHQLTYAPKGHTIQDLADKYGVSWNEINKRNILLGLKRKMPNFVLLERDIMAGLPNSEIALKYRVDVKTVYNRKKKLGLTGKRGSNQWAKLQ